MKKLLDYVNEWNPNNNGFNYEEYLNEANNFKDWIDSSITKRIKDGEYIDFLYENLLTHDYKKLQYKLKQYYPYFEFIDYDNGSFYIAASNINELKKDDKFRSIVEFYGYTISEWTDDKTQKSIFIEPNESKDVTDYIYKECHGICYHVCDNKKLDDIMSSGLRCKNNSYRSYPKRIYLYGTKEAILEDDDFKQVINKIKSPFNRHGYSVLRINLRDSKIPFRFYKDTAMRQSGAVYTYNNIPKKLIEKINFSI